MKKLLLLLLFPSMMFAQLEVGIGYIGNGTYGKAYLDVGDYKLGGQVVIGGDSQITQGNYNEGTGFVGLNAWYNVLEGFYGTDHSLKFRLGAEIEATYVAADDRIQELIEFRRRPEYVSNKTNLVFGVSYGYKFLQFNLNYANGIETGFGFRLKR